MTDLEFEVQKALKQLDNYRTNHAPTDLCDDYMACAAGALIHQQKMLRAQHEAIKKMRAALQLIRASEVTACSHEYNKGIANAALTATEEYK